MKWIAPGIAIAALAACGTTPIEDRNERPQAANPERKPEDPGAKRVSDGNSDETDKPNETTKSDKTGTNETNEPKETGKTAKTGPDREQPKTGTKEPVGGGTKAREPKISPNLGTHVVQGEKRKNGLSVLEVPGGDGSLARISLFVEAGSGRDRKGKPGLATLARRCLRASGQGGRTSEVLDETLANLDARLTLTEIGRFVRIEGIAPTENALPLARTMYRFVVQDPVSRSVVESERARLAAELTRTRDARARHSAIRRMLGEDVATLEAEELSVAGFSDAEVRLFVGLHYRPENSLLAVALPKPARRSSMTEILEVFDEWRSDVPLSLIDRPGAVTPLAFVERENQLAEVIAMIRTPRIEVTGTGREEVLWQLFCLDGTGGRLRGELAKRGFVDLVPTIEEISTGRTHVRALVFRVPPINVPAIVTALREGFADLAIRETTTAELRAAKRRTRFLWDLAMSDPRVKIRAHATSALLGQRPGLEDRVRRSIARLQIDEIGDIARQRFVPAILVRGPESAQPTDARLLPKPRRLAPLSSAGDRIRPLTGSPEVIAERERLALAKVRRAVGGSEALRALDRIEFASTCRFTASVPFRERWDIHVADGAYRRERTILGLRILTSLDPKKATELIDENERKLGATEAAFFRLEAQLHPTVIMARNVAGKIPLKLVGRLPDQDRPLLVFAWDRDGGVVRVAVDEQNGLPRRVEYLEWQPKATPRRATLHFEQYQPVGALRGPRLVKKYVDGELRGEMRLTYGSELPTPTRSR